MASYCAGLTKRVRLDPAVLVLPHYHPLRVIDEIGLLDVQSGGPGPSRGAGLGLRSRVDALEAQLVKDALIQTDGNQTRAARLLGLSRFGLQKMLKRLQIPVPK